MTKTSMIHWRRSWNFLNDKKCTHHIISSRAWTDGKDLGCGMSIHNISNLSRPIDGSQKNVSMLAGELHGTEKILCKRNLPKILMDVIKWKEISKAGHCFNYNNVPSYVTIPKSKTVSSIYTGASFWLLSNSTRGGSNRMVLKWTLYLKQQNNSPPVQGTLFIRRLSDPNSHAIV